MFSNGKKKFFACSACRDHKLCQFYVEFDDGKKLDEKQKKKFFDRYLDINKKAHLEFEKKYFLFLFISKNISGN